MKEPLHKLALLYLTLCTISDAQVARVISINQTNQTITVSQPKKDKWNLEDELCASRKLKVIACGKVIAIGSDYAIARITFTKRKQVQKKTVDTKRGRYVFGELGRYEVLVGDHVDKLKYEAMRLPASLGENSPSDKSSHSDSEENTSDTQLRKRLSAISVFPQSLNLNEVYKLDQKKRFAQIRSATYLAPEALKPQHPISRTLASVSQESFLSSTQKTRLTSIDAGLNFLFPTAHLQQTITRNFVSGLMPSFVSLPVDTGNINGYGLYLTFSYFSDRPFAGLWLQSAIGFFDLQATEGTLKDDFTAFTSMATLGWRWLWESGLNIGLAGGIQYLFSPTAKQVSFALPKALPSIQLAIGYAF